MGKLLEGERGRAICTSAFMIGNDTYNIEKLCELIRRYSSDVQHEYHGSDIVKGRAYAGINKVRDGIEQMEHLVGYMKKEADKIENRVKQFETEAQEPHNG